MVISLNLKFEYLDATARLMSTKAMAKQATTVVAAATMIANLAM